MSKGPSTMKSKLPIIAKEKMSFHFLIFIKASNSETISMATVNTLNFFRSGGMVSRLVWLSQSAPPIWPSHCRGGASSIPYGPFLLLVRDGSLGFSGMYVHFVRMVRLEPMKSPNSSIAITPQAAITYVRLGGPVVESGVDESDAQRERQEVWNRASLTLGMDETF